MQASEMSWLACMSMLKLTATPPIDGVPASTLSAIEERLRTADPATLASKGQDWIEEALILVESIGCDRLTLEVEPSSQAHDSLASAKGMHLERDLLQMRRSLPFDEPWELELRAFRPEEDDLDWLRVNNRAFAWHPDQGDWTTEDLRCRISEPWFDPQGFLIHEVDGEIIGFCWTKVHKAEVHKAAVHKEEIQEAESPEEFDMGEIYVIGVDPSSTTRGLGRALLRAGLDHLAGLGLGQAFLYVESDNEPALGLYVSEGFEIHHHHRWWTAEFA